MLFNRALIYPIRCPYSIFSTLDTFADRSYFLCRSNVHYIVHNGQPNNSSQTIQPIILCSILDIPAQLYGYYVLCNSIKSITMEFKSPLISCPCCKTLYQPDFPTKVFLTHAMLKCMNLVGTAWPLQGKRVM